MEKFFRLNVGKDIEIKIVGDNPSYILGKILEVYHDSVLIDSANVQTIVNYTHVIFARPVVE